MPKLLFKKAETASEFQQIHALNHRVFAEEIAQHATDGSGLLIDRFHGRNRYFIAMRGETVIGMISAHDGPEFSIARRLPDPSILRELPRPLEVRLLAVHPQERNSTVLAGLLWQMYEFAVAGQYSHVLISGISERLPMYQKIGFRPLGPAVRDGEASFVPMMLTLGDRRQIGETRVRLHERRWNRMADRKMPISLMPGPVCIHPSVAEAFSRPPVSHRCAEAVDCFEHVRQLLEQLAGGMKVALFPGAGTLANDAVAANLRALFGEREGLVLTNGEFGERIGHQAERAGLRFRRIDFGWGGGWSFDAIGDALERKPEWIWCVHIETSTGMLNDVNALLGLARSSGIPVALDCVSSVGAYPVPSEAGPLLLASGVSGKSLGSYAGLAFVYMSEACMALLADKELCPSFDLYRMQQTRGPLSTIPTSLLFALACALERSYGSRDAAEGRYREYEALGQYVRGELKTAGLQPLVPDAMAAPHITTLALPSPLFPDECQRAGYQIAYESAYLQARGWGQFATMGNVTRADLEPLFEALQQQENGRAG